jgi:hypothetical protein
MATRNASSFTSSEPGPAFLSPDAALIVPRSHTCNPLPGSS